MGMRFGVFVPQGWRMDLVEIDDPVEQYEAMTAAARVADEAYWDAIWVYDHFHTVPTPEIETTFECWTITSTLARDTKRVNVGQMVGCNGYRNPALYAKIASTVDVASHHRLYAGIGAGWYEHEWRAYGYDWHETSERMGRFKEAVEVIQALWTQEKAVYQGKRYRLDGAINEPKGAGNKPPRFWIGGGGETVTLKLVAKYADGCNVANGDPVLAKQKLAVLQGHCDALGRDSATITKSTSLNVHLVEPGDDKERATAAFRKAMNNISYEDFTKAFIVGTPADVRARVEQLAAVGIDYVIIYLARAAYEPQQIRYLGGELAMHFR